MSRGDDPDHKYRKERDRIKNSDLSQRDREALLDFLVAHHPEMGGEESLSYNSLENYGRALRLIAKNSDRELVEHKLASLKEVFEEFQADLSEQTVRQRQAAAIKFYRYHNLDPDPDDIPLTHIGNGSKVNEHDMFDREDIQALRDACTNTRDRCLIELLLYTGQRIRAIQTLRIKDIDLEENVYYLNTDELGLKGADKTGQKRPLLGATKAVREWLDHHPTGDPEDHLITTLPSATNTGEAGEYLSRPAIKDRLDRIADAAKIDKPANPHNFRHAFVTICHRRYDMDAATIKFLIGHGEGSTIMEETYSHLTDEDHINAAREAAEGVGEEPDEQESELTPKVCPTCDENLPPGAKACSSCGMVFTPDAVEARRQMKEKVREEKEEVETLEEYKDADAIAQALEDDPTLAAELMDKLGELSDK